MQMDKTKWLPVIDEYLADKSWSATFNDMMEKIETAINNK
jgi:abortive infection bacteriophage resistance protein